MPCHAQDEFQTTALLKVPLGTSDKKDWVPSSGQESSVPSTAGETMVL